MKEIYQVTIHGRKLESCDLKQLLARAVREKRDSNQRLRMASSLKRTAACGWVFAGQVPSAFSQNAMR